MKITLINRPLAIAILVLPLLLAGIVPASAQQNTREVPVKDLLKLPGKLIGEVKDASSDVDSDLKLTGYRIEELSLPRSLTVEVQGRQAVVDRAWRITVNGGPFPVRAMPAVIWIDDQIVGNGIENPSLSQITAITFDESLLREGGVVSISYGQDKNARVKVSQRLQLRREGGIQ